MVDLNDPKSHEKFAVDVKLLLIPGALLFLLVGDIYRMYRWMIGRTKTAVGRLAAVFFIYRILKANHDRVKAKQEKKKMKQEKKKQ